MKRLFTTMSIVCLFACTIFGQSSIEVNLDKASLEESLKDVKEPIHNLTLSGKPRPEDFDYLRSKILSDIRKLDLSDVDLDTIPSKTFYAKINYTPPRPQIILPKTLKHLADNALLIITDYGYVIYELASSTYPTLGKDVYNSPRQYNPNEIRPSSGNTSFIFDNNILYSSDGITAYHYNGGGDDVVKKGTRLIYGNFMENGRYGSGFTLSETIDSIGDRAFANVYVDALIDGIGRIEFICLAPIPPKLGKDVFLGSDICIVPVYVPDESVELYRSTEGWKELSIEPLSSRRVNGIEDITTNKQSSSDFFDLQGRKVQKTTKGVYIKDGKKAFVK